MQRSLIAFERDDVVGFLVLDLLGDGALAAHRVDGDDGALDRHHVEQRRNGDDLVGLLGDRDLPQHQPLPGRESRNHVDRLLGVLPGAGAARGLAVDGDDFGARLDECRNPGDETPAEGLRVERGEDVAEMIMRRRPACERPKAAQESELLLAKTRDVGEGLGPCQYGQQAQEQDLVERINDLARLPMVRHVFEISKKNRRLGQRRAITSRLSHRTILRPEAEDVDRFSSNPFCHLLLHPIALFAGAWRVGLACRFGYSRGEGDSR